VWRRKCLRDPNKMSLRDCHRRPCCCNNGGNLQHCGVSFTDCAYSCNFHVDKACFDASLSTTTTVTAWTATITSTTSSTTRATNKQMRLSTSNLWHNSATLRQTGLVYAEHYKDNVHYSNKRNTTWFLFRLQLFPGVHFGTISSVSLPF
jgi:hypothetical protein